jgi:hypothetical protein
VPPSKHRLRELPSIDRVLGSAAGPQLIARYRRDYVTRRCRELIGGLHAGAKLPIIGPIKDGAFLLDLRTIFDADEVIPRW